MKTIKSLYAKIKLFVIIFNLIWLHICIANDLNWLVKGMGFISSGFILYIFEKKFKNRDKT